MCGGGGVWGVGMGGGGGLANLSSAVQAHPGRWQRLQPSHRSPSCARLSKAPEVAGCPATHETNKTTSCSQNLHTTEEVRRAKDLAERKKAKEERRKARTAAAEAGAGASAASSSAAAAKPPVPATPIAFLFPGQGSQAVGMLKVRKAGAETGAGHVLLYESLLPKLASHRVPGRLHTVLFAQLALNLQTTLMMGPPPLATLQESAELPAVKKMLETAKKVLGYDLLQVCLP